MDTEFSRYEIKKSHIKIDGEETKAITLNCVGSVEEELNTKTVSKSCEGVVKKQRTRGDGTCTLTVSLHIPYNLYKDIYGMVGTGLIEGVNAYGKNSLHKVFTYTAIVKDEDGNELLVAYPCCVVTSGPKSSIENGAEEISEGELEISIMPDEYDNCKYEIFVSKLPEDKSITKEKWLTEFTPSMVQVPIA